MKKLKVSKKILMCFSIVIALTLVLGIASLLLMLNIDKSYSDAYDESAVPMPYISKIISGIYRARIEMRHLSADKTGADAAESTMKTIQADIEAAMQSFETADRSSQPIPEYGTAKALYEEQFHYNSELVRHALAGDTEAFDEVFPVATQANLDIIAAFEHCMDVLIANGQANSVANTSKSYMLAAGIAALLAAAVGLAVFLGLLLTKNLNIPIKEVADAADKVASGDIDIALNYDSPDEIGDLGRSFMRMVDGIREQNAILLDISEGDYSGRIDMRSGQDVINRSIGRILDKNNQMLSDIRDASVQVSSGSQEIAQSAQNLASGSTEQAATIEEFSSTLSEVQEQAEETNKVATRTLNETHDAGRLMGVATDYMNRMNDSMTKISDSSQSIAKVIKVIDDIAFQTNILSLNAAVEAARAGQHGKGFAVVADEVRNLANKSAVAAKETAALIENSIQCVTEGNMVAEKTGESLAEVGKIAANNAVSMQMLSDSSQRQSDAISDLNNGIVQLSAVVQANSATAEESAAASEEMSAQAAMLNQIVEQFRLRDSGLEPLHKPEQGREPQGVSDSGFSLAGDKY